MQLQVIHLTIGPCALTVRLTKFDEVVFSTIENTAHEASVAAGKTAVIIGIRARNCHGARACLLCWFESRDAEMLVYCLL